MTSFVLPLFLPLGENVEITRKKSLTKKVYLSPSLFRLFFNARVNPN